MLLLASLTFPSSVNGNAFCPRVNMCATLLKWNWLPPQWTIVQWWNMRVGFVGKYGCNSTSDDKLRLDMFGGQCIFPVVLRRIATCNILQMYTKHVHTFPLNTSFGQGTPPLATITTCSWHRHKTCCCYCTPSSLHTFVANRQVPWRKHSTTKSLRACDGRKTEPMVGRLWLPSSANCMELPAICICRHAASTSWYYHRPQW